MVGGGTSWRNQSRKIHAQNALTEKYSERPKSRPESVLTAEFLTVKYFLTGKCLQPVNIFDRKGTFQQDIRLQKALAEKYSERPKSRPECVLTAEFLTVKYFLTGKCLQPVNIFDRKGTFQQDIRPQKALAEKYSERPKSRPECVLTAEFLAVKFLHRKMPNILAALFLTASCSDRYSSNRIVITDSCLKRDVSIRSKSHRQVGTDACLVTVPVAVLVAA